MSGRNGAEEEEGEPCNVCGEVPESIIYLNCDHKMCLLCTARTVFETGQAVGDEVACPQCGKSTAISPELQEALEELLSAEDSERESVAETSVMAAGEGDASAAAAAPRPSQRPRALMCPLHAGEEFVYYHAGERRLLCAQCALREAEARAERVELRPLRRCLPQAVQAFARPFADAELQAKRLGVCRAELDFRRKAFLAAAEARQRRLVDALDEISELVADFKASTEREFRLRLDAGLARVKAVDGELRAREGYFTAICRKFAALRAQKGSDSAALAFVLDNGDELQRRMDEAAECPQEAKVALVEEEAADAHCWLDDRSRRIREMLEIKLCRSLGAVGETLPCSEDRVAPAELEWTQPQFKPRPEKTAFSFRPHANVLLARLQERARGEEVPRSPFRASPAANSTPALTARRATATKPWADDSQLRPQALAYSALQRRRIDTKLRAAGGAPPPL